MSNYYLFKVGDHPTVSNLSDIDTRKLENFPLPILRASTNGKILVEKLEWETIGECKLDEYNRVTFDLHS